MPDTVPVSQYINGLVTEKVLSDASGLGLEALSHYRRDGKVKEGVHWIHANNGRIMWYVEKFNEWLRGSKYTKERSGSGSNGKVSAGTKRQISNQTLRV